jgi:hypothetical protein
MQNIRVLFVYGKDDARKGRYTQSSPMGGNGRNTPGTTVPDGLHGAMPLARVVFAVKLRGGKAMASIAS